MLMRRMRDNFHFVRLCPVPQYSLVDCDISGCFDIIGEVQGGRIQ